MRGGRPVDPRNDCIDLYHSPTIYAPVCAALGLCGGFGKCKIFGGGWSAATARKEHRALQPVILPLQPSVC
jgi:hypothetical protein